MADRLRYGISCISRKIAFGVFGFICFYLFFLSIFSTCVIWYDTEATYYMKDFPVLLMTGLMGMTGLAFFFRRLLGKILDRRRLFMGAATVIWAVLVIIFVANTKLELVYDQRMVHLAMKGFLEGDYSPWQQGGYMYAYPFQNSLAFLYLPLMMLFGENTYIAVQLVNILFLEWMALGFYKLSKRFFGSDVAFFSYVGTLFFLPMWGYLKYMYGNLPGLSLTIWSVYFLAKYMDEGKWKDAGASAGCILFAVAYKGTFLIYLFAMLIVLLTEWIVKKKNKNLFAAAILLGAALLGANGASLIIQGITGCRTNEGIPKTHCIAMGLRESYVAPGWYSGDAMKWFEENGFSQEACIQDDLEGISRSFALFGKEKEYGLRFFGRKIASAWNNPTFECFAVVVKGNLHGTIDYWMKDILYSGGVMNTILTIFMDILQSMYLFGAVLYMMYCRKEHELRKAVPLIALIGGFLMHIFWEAKCQYTIIYFAVLIPYAFAGYKECIGRLSRGFARKPVKDVLYQSAAVRAFAVLLAVVVGMALWNPVFLTSTIKLGGDGGDYIWMCQEMDYWRSESFTKEGPR